MNYEISTYKNKYTETLNNEYIERIFFIYLYILYILFNYKARDNTNKNIAIYYVVWTRLTRVGCFNRVAHYKRMRIADKNNVHCTF